MMEKNKKKKVLLINPPNLEEIVLNKEDYVGDLGFQPIPVGLLIIFKSIQQSNYDVELVNFFDEKFSSWEIVTNFLLGKDDVSFVGITCSTRQRFSINKLIEICAQTLPKANLFLGGPHVSFLKEAYFKRFANVHAIIAGEGDDSVLNYLNMCCTNNLHSSQGISYRESPTKINISNEMGRAENINRVIPIYEDKLLDDFRKVKDLNMHLKNADVEIENDLMAPIICSRGCTGSCLFCSNGSFFASCQKYYDVNIAYKEIEYYYSKNIKLFDFYDDNFTNDKNFVMSLCELIIKSKMGIRWWCSSRVDAVDEQMLSKMKEAGCFKISYGVESGSQKVLKHIRKNTTKEQIIHAFNITHKLGLIARATISLGHVVEDNQTIMKTASLLNIIKPDNIGIFLLKIYPGTGLYYYCIENGFINDEYWFDKNQHLVPFFTCKSSLQELKDFRDLLINSLDVVAKVSDGGDINAGSYHYELKW